MKDTSLPSSDGRPARPTPDGRFDAPAFDGRFDAPAFDGRFVRPDGSPLQYGELVALARNADYILVGETHDSKTDHLAQAHLLRLVAGSGQRPALGLEMLPHSRFSVPLYEFSAGSLSLDDLPEALEWKRSWGYDFALYRPVFEAARDYGTPVYGLNVENDVRRAVSRKGLNDLTRKEKRGLPSRIIPPLPEQREELAEFFQTHNAMMRRSREAKVREAAGEAARKAARKATGEAARKAAETPDVRPVSLSGPAAGDSPELPASLRAPFERFLLVQSLWDSVMAEQAVAARKKGASPLIVLAGGGHVGKGYGIAHRLGIFEPQARILSVMPFAGERPEAGDADIFYHSPRRERPGYGISFASQGDAVRIAAVAPGSRAEKAGLKPGDVIVRAGDRAIRTPRDLHEAAQAGSLTLTVEREGGELAVRLEGIIP